MPDEPPTAPTAPNVTIPPPRRCVACGYDLFGLGDEPRCPECGLLNIPEGLRKQVWEFVDSRRWFYSDFFTPWKKRPPGWWWALDRPGDVRRSLTRLGVHLVISFGLTFILFIAGSSIQVETRFDKSYRLSNQPNVPWRHAGFLRYSEDFRGWRTAVERSSGYDQVPVPDPAKGVWNVTQERVSRRLDFRLTTDDVITPMTWGVALAALWAGPAIVGMWTQIRRGLPAFARAPRTIFVAANLEAHRLSYAPMFAGLMLALDTLRRLALGDLSYQWARVLSSILWYAPVLFAIAGWIGPLRSDYTRQLIRGKLHLIRIIIMYAVLFPCVILVVWALLLFWIEYPEERLLFS